MMLFCAAESRYSFFKTVCKPFLLHLAFGLLYSNREYLGEATCSSTRELELSDCGLGDCGYKSLLSVCRALSHRVRVHVCVCVCVCVCICICVHTCVDTSRVARMGRARSSALRSRENHHPIAPCLALWNHVVSHTKTLCRCA